MYEVRLADEARRFREEADAPLQRKLDRCFQILADDPRHHRNIKAPRGRLAGLRRFRVGDYRVIFRIEDSPAVVLVAAIVHRRDAYE